MEKEKIYTDAIFQPEVLAASKAIFLVQCGEAAKEVDNLGLRVTRGDVTWRFDDEQEFFAEYRNSNVDAYYAWYGAHNSLTVTSSGHRTRISVKLPKRSEIEAVFEIFERAYPSSRVPVPVERPRIFIGHGQSPVWRDLKDHLHDKHGFDVEAYEIGARAGHTIRDILENMLKRSSFALLVLTGEDKTAGGELLARQNVVHEAGLFQGHLGFSRAIVLLEDGTKEFSNIAGLQQLRFSKANIKEVYGDVLATIRREFGG